MNEMAVDLNVLHALMECRILNIEVGNPVTKMHTYGHLSVNA